MFSNQVGCNYRFSCAIFSKLEQFEADFHWTEYSSSRVDNIEIEVRRELEKGSKFGKRVQKKNKPWVLDCRSTHRPRTG